MKKQHAKVNKEQTEVVKLLDVRKNEVQAGGGEVGNRETQAVLTESLYF